MQLFNLKHFLAAMVELGDSGDANTWNVSVEVGPGNKVWVVLFDVIDRVTYSISRTKKTLVVRTRHWKEELDAYALEVTLRKGQPVWTKCDTGVVATPHVVARAIFNTMMDEDQLV